MGNPRRAILAQMETALQAMTTANYDIPRSVREVTRRGKMIDQVPPDGKPGLVILTEENETEPHGISGVKHTTLTVAILIYEIIRNGEEPADVLDRYADAVTDILETNRYWGGLAYTTTVGGVAQHEIMESMLPDAKTTVAAQVRYIWAQDDAA